jgi:hypothetical protein
MGATHTRDSRPEGPARRPPPFGPLLSHSIARQGRKPGAGQGETSNGSLSRESLALCPAFVRSPLRPRPRPASSLVSVRWRCSAPSLGLAPSAEPPCTAPASASLTPLALLPIGPRTSAAPRPAKQRPRGCPDDRRRSMSSERDPSANATFIREVRVRHHGAQWRTAAALRHRHDAVAFARGILSWSRNAIAEHPLHRSRRATHTMLSPTQSAGDPLAAFDVALSPEE